MHFFLKQPLGPSPLTVLASFVLHSLNGYPTRAFFGLEVLTSIIVLLLWHPQWTITKVQLSMNRRATSSFAHVARNLYSNPCHFFLLCKHLCRLCCLSPSSPFRKIGCAFRLHVFKILLLRLASPAPTVELLPFGLMMRCMHLILVFSTPINW